MCRHKNIEGYSDPTAGTAVSRVMKEYKTEQQRIFNAKNRKKIYVVSKYAGNINANTKNAARYCRYIIDQGFMPIASHLLYPQILNDDVSTERELGTAFGLSLLAICDEVWVFIDGQISSGMKQEIEEANRLKIPVKRLNMGVS